MSTAEKNKTRKAPTYGLFTVRDLVTGPESPWTGVERLVALAVGDRLGSNPDAWPSIRGVMQWTGLGETSVKTALTALCDPERGIFVKTPGARPGLDTNRYSLRGAAAVGGGSPHDPVATRPRRHTTPGGSPHDPVGGRHASANESVERINERITPTRSRGGVTAAVVERQTETAHGKVNDEARDLFGHSQASVETAPLRRAAKVVKPSKSKNKLPESWPPNAVGQALDLWKPWGAVSPGALASALALVGADGWAWPDVRAALERWLQADNARFGPHVFARSVGQAHTGVGIRSVGGGRESGAERDARRVASLATWASGV